jgi:hypothetical protein
MVRKSRGGRLYCIIASDQTNEWWARDKMMRDEMRENTRSHEPTRARARTSHPIAKSGAPVESNPSSARDLSSSRPSHQSSTPRTSPSPTVNWNSPDCSTYPTRKGQISLPLIPSQPRSPRSRSRSSPYRSSPRTFELQTRPANSTPLNCLSSGCVVPFDSSLPTFRFAPFSGSSPAERNGERSCVFRREERNVECGGARPNSCRRGLAPSPSPHALLCCAYKPARMAIREVFCRFLARRC